MNLGPAHQNIILFMWHIVVFALLKYAIRSIFF